MRRSLASPPASAVQWDRWSAVESARKKKSGEAITLVCIANDWHPLSLASAKAADSLRRDPSFPKHSQLFVVNGDDPDDRAALHKAYGVTSTPTYLVFHLANVLTLRRPKWQDDNKFAGSLSWANILELLHSVKMAVDAEKKVQIVRVDVA